jgi:1,3-beta-glucanosyltransferase GAS5
MDNGAGAGPGLVGDGSQNAVGSGLSPTNVTGGEASPRPNAAGMTFGSPMETSPFIVSGLAILFTLFGAFFL